MRILVGIDLGRDYVSTLHLANRLRFEAPKFTLAHVVDTSMAFGGYSVISEAPMAYDYYAQASKIGQEAVDEAEKTAKGLGLDCEGKLLTGSATALLTKVADDLNADLICVHSERKSALGSLFLGSVCRGVAIGAHHSLLISKGEFAAAGDLIAVFATDHSDYANRALDRFLEMNPKGIRRIHVVTALHISSLGTHPELADLHTQIQRDLLSEAASKTDTVVNRLASAGYSATGEVVNLTVNDAISQVMDQTKADLLFIGAQGHGFMHRVMLGSTSMHQIVAEPYSVLVIRP